MKTSSTFFACTTAFFLLMILPWTAFTQQNEAAGNWFVKGPKFSAEVSGIVVNPQNNRQLMIGTRGTFVETASGLWLSDNGGVGWREAPAPLDNVTIETMFRIDNTVFVSANNDVRSNLNGSYYSHDFGQSWTRFPAPLDTAFVISMVKAGNTIYAGMVATHQYHINNPLGLYRSDDGGITWQATGLTGQAIARLLYDEQNDRLFAGSHFWHNDRSFAGDFFGGNDLSNGFFYKNSGETTWNQVTIPVNPADGDEGDDGIEALLMRPDGTLLIGTYREGLFSWSDGFGLNSAPEFSDNSRVRHLLFEAGIMFAASNNLLFKSIDEGLTWVAAFSTPGGRNITALHSDGCSGCSYLFLGTDGEGAFISQDDGNEWEPSQAPMNSSSVQVFASDANGIDTYSGTVNIGVHRAPNGSPSAVWVPTADYDTRLPTLEAFVNDRSVLAHGAGGIYYSADAGETWLPSNSQMNRKGRIVNDIAFHEDTQTYVAAVAEGAEGMPDVGVWFSRSGTNWVQANPGDQPISSVTAYGDYFFAGSGSETGLFRVAANSIDSSAFEQLPGVDVNVSIDFFFHDNNGNLYACSRSGLFYTSDAENWNLVSGQGGFDNLWVTDMIEAHGRHYAATRNNAQNAGVYFSANGIDGWTRGTGIPGDEDIISLSAVTINDTAFVVAGTEGDFFSNVSARIYVSSDAGDNWSLADIPNPAGIKNGINIIEVNGRFYAAANFFGAMRSIDGGRKWRPLVTGLDEEFILRISYMEIANRLFLSTLKGVYLQKIDNVHPEADIIFFDTDKSGPIPDPDSPGDSLIRYFTKTPNIKLFLEGSDISADTLGNPDSMLVSEDLAVVQAGDRGWIPYDQTLDWDLGSENGEKVIFARFKDVSWNMSRVLSDTVILDTVQPDFMPFPHRPPSMVSIDQDSLLFAQNVFEPHLETIWVQLNRTGNSRNKDTREKFDGTSATVYDYNVTSRGMEYRIFAQDFAGNIDTLSNSLNGPNGAMQLSFFSLPVTLNPGGLGNSPGLNAGTSLADYRFISIPMQFEGSHPLENLVGDIGKYGKKDDWLFYSFNGNSNRVEGENHSFQTGGANLIIVRKSRTLTNNIAGNSMPLTAGVTGDIPGWQLRGGDWNLIGNPYNAEIKPGQLKLMNESTAMDTVIDLAALRDAGRVYIFDGQWRGPGADNEEQVRLRPWSGLFVWANMDDRVVFRNSEDPFAEPPRRPANKFSKLGTLAEVRGNEWLIRMDAESRGYADEPNYLGVKRAAQEGLDDWDSYDQPLLPGGFSAGFVHRDWEYPAWLRQDIRPADAEGQRWDIEVKGAAGLPVTLRFSEFVNLPEHYRIILLDEATGLVRDLEIQPAVEVRVAENSNNKIVSVLVGDEDYLFRSIDGLDLIPTAFELFNNYPNPFNPSTIVRYALPVNGKVTLKVYDLLGRVVQTLEKDNLRQPGYYEHVVDLRSNASGFYFVQFAVSGEQNFTRARKMLLVK